MQEKLYWTIWFGKPWTIRSHDHASCHFL